MIGTTLRSLEYVPAAVLRHLGAVWSGPRANGCIGPTRRRRSEKIAELPPFRQELEAMCFAAVCLGTLVDGMLRLLEIRIMSIWNWGHKVVAERLIPARVHKKSEIWPSCWGQWWDSIYLCDYAAQPTFRRSVNRILVSIACSFSPGLIPSDSRIFDGIVCTVYRSRTGRAVGGLPSCGLPNCTPGG
jgi:hypothetical protein